MASTQIVHNGKKLGRGQFQNGSSSYNQDGSDYEPAVARRKPLIQFALNDIKSSSDSISLQENRSVLRDSSRKMNIHTISHGTLDEVVTHSKSPPSFCAKETRSSSRNTRKSAIQDVIKQIQCSSDWSRKNATVMCRSLLTSPNLSSKSPSSSSKSLSKNNPIVDSLLDSPASSSRAIELSTKSVPILKTASSDIQSPLQQLFRHQIHNCKDEFNDQLPASYQINSSRCNRIDNVTVDTNSSSKNGSKSVIRHPCHHNHSFEDLENEIPSLLNDNVTSKHCQNIQVALVRKRARNSKRDPVPFRYPKDCGRTNLESPRVGKSMLIKNNVPSTGHTTPTEISTPGSDSLQNDIPSTDVSDSLKCIRMQLSHLFINDTDHSDNKTNKSTNVLQSKPVENTVSENFHRIIQGNLSGYNDCDDKYLKEFSVEGEKYAHHESQSLSMKVDVVTLKSKVSSLELQLKSERQARELDKERFLKDEARLKAQVQNLIKSVAKGKTAAQYAALEAKLETQRSENYLLQQQIDESEQYIHTLEKNIEDNLKAWEEEEEAFRKEMSDKTSSIETYEENIKCANDRIEKLESRLLETTKEISKLLENASTQNYSQENENSLQRSFHQSSEQFMEMSNLLRIEHIVLHKELDIKKSFEEASKRSTADENQEAEISRLKDELKCATFHVQDMKKLSSPSWLSQADKMVEKELSSERINEYQFSQKSGHVDSNKIMNNRDMLEYDENISFQEELSTGKKIELSPEDKISCLQKELDTYRAQSLDNDTPSQKLNESMGNTFANEFQEIDVRKTVIPDTFKVQVQHWSTDGDVEIKLRDGTESMISSLSKTDLITSMTDVNCKSYVSIEIDDVVMKARSFLKEGDDSESEGNILEFSFDSSGSNVSSCDSFNCAERIQDFDDHFPSIDHRESIKKSSLSSYINTKDDLSI